MGRNVEIKARVPDPAGLRTRVSALATSGPHVLVQRDLFFHCPRGWLKLRIDDERGSELIAYERPAGSAPRPSLYERTRVEEPEALTQVLAAALGACGEVRKTRTLFMVGRTRVHLDVVEQLGDFMELEVVLADDEPIEAGEREAIELMASFGVEQADLLDLPYVELLGPPGH